MSLNAFENHFTRLKKSPLQPVPQKRAASNDDDDSAIISAKRCFQIAENSKFSDDFENSMDDSDFQCILDNLDVKKPISVPKNETKTDLSILESLTLLRLTVETVEARLLNFIML